MNLSESCGIIILAAGGSSRLGRPKQLLLFNDKTLVRHVSEEAQKFAGNKVVLVSGAAPEAIESEVGHLNLSVVNNPEWQTGMSSSVKCGLKTILSGYPALQNVIVTVCDQPFISARLFVSMVDKKLRTSKEIISANYGAAQGVPVLFGSKYFEELRTLNGQEGAKKILTRFPEDCDSVDFPEGACDIDTEADYQGLLNRDDPSSSRYTVLKLIQ